MVLDDVACNFLRRSVNVQLVGKSAPDAIGGENQCVPVAYRKHGGRNVRQLRAHRASPKEQRLLPGDTISFTTEEDAGDVSHPHPCHGVIGQTEPCHAQYRPASALKVLLAAAEQ